MKNSPWYGARRLWLDDKGSQWHIFMAVRRIFTAEELWKNVQLRIMADSDFIAYIDGAECGRGQFSDHPEAPTYTDIMLNDIPSGEHILAICVYHCGKDFPRYAPGIPGVVFTLSANNSVKVLSDENCRVYPAPGYHAGAMPEVSPQLGFTTLFDARIGGANEWMNKEFDDRNWLTPYAEMEKRPMDKRPDAARPVLEPFQPGRLIRSGVCKRNGEKESFAATMASDQVFWFYSDIGRKLERWPETAEGWAQLYDLGEEKVGFIELELTAPAGTIVDIAHGEHLHDGNVRMEIMGANFADRYICKEGRQRFQLHFRRIGGRYIQLHLLPPEGATTLSVHSVGIAPWTLLLPDAADFAADDEQLLEIRKLSIRTLQHCMHEHYEDCPWREQALYTYDSRNQMLYGYYLWGNYDFAAASLNLFSGAMREDGFLRLTAPSRFHRLIPVFTTIWPLEIYEHLLFSGDFSVWDKQRDNLRCICAKLLALRDEKSALYRADGEGYWHFYEWAPGLNIYKMQPDEIHSLYNLYFANMLEAMGKLESLSGNTVQSSEYLAEAERIRRRVDELFFAENEDCYDLKINNGTLQKVYTEHVQIMMLHNRAVPEYRRERVLQRLLKVKSGLVPVTLSVMPYLLEALLLNDCGSAAREFVHRKLEENYYIMLDGESTTLWETVKGSSDFSFRGSLCHGWSSLPVYYCGAGLLGVYPLEPGFKRFRVRPWNGGREFAQGSVPTPSGNIKIAWQRNKEGRFDLQIEYPAELTPQIESLDDTLPGKIDLLPY